MRFAHIICSWSLLVLVACGHDRSSPSPDRLAIDSMSATLAIDGTIGLHATYSQREMSFAATDVLWSTSDDSIASVDGTHPTAIVTAHAAGSATITATGRGLTATSTITVTAATLVSIAITPPVPSVAAGTSVQLVATGTFSDYLTADVTPQAVWSNEGDAASVSSMGLVHGVSPGGAEITATVGKVMGSTTVAVTSATLELIELSPDVHTLARGTTLQMTATATFTDGSTQDLSDQITWVSTTEDTASVSATGRVTARASGTTTIRARSGTVTGSTLIAISDAALTSIMVTPTAPSIANGTEQQFTARAVFDDGSNQDVTDQVRWSSSDEAVATISNEGATRGLVTSLATGVTAIAATLGAVGGSSTLTVTAARLRSIAISPSAPSIALGVNPQFMAIGTFTNGSTQDLTAQVLWDSSNRSVAQISNAADSEGRATTLSKGRTTIRATAGTVTSERELAVSDAALLSIAIEPLERTARIHTTIELKATGTYTDGARDVTAAATWTSSNESVATISNATGSERVTTLDAGTTRISAALAGSSTATTLHVLPSVVTTVPADAEPMVSTLADLVIAFDAPMEPASLTAQTSAGFCTDTVQVSRDDFTTCVALGEALPVMSAGDRVARYAFATELPPDATLKIRVEGSAATTTGVRMDSPFTSAIAFRTGGSAHDLVISQLYGGGGNAGATFKNDFIELHNNGPSAVPLAGLGVQQASAAGTAWTVTALSGVIPPGGFLLIESAAGSSGTQALPTPDATNDFAMSTTSGKVIVASTTTAFTVACPSNAVIDVVGYGAANCAETVPMAAPSNSTSAIRGANGCTDTGNNLLDFAIDTPGPRNSGSAAANCP